MADESNTPSKSKSFLTFFTTLPGIITALTGLITAIGGLVFVLNKSGCAHSKESAKIDTTAKHAVAIDTLFESTANISFSPQQIKHTTRNLTYKIVEANTETLPDQQVVLTLKIKCVNDSKYDYNFYSRYISVKIGEDSYPPSPYSQSEAYQAIDAKGFKDLEYNYKLPAGTKNFTLVFYDEENQIGVSSFTIK